MASRVKTTNVFPACSNLLRIAACAAMCNFLSLSKEISVFYRNTLRQNLEQAVEVLREARIEVADCVRGVHLDARGRVDQNHPEVSTARETPHWCVMGPETRYLQGIRNMACNVSLSGDR